MNNYNWVQYHVTKLVANGIPRDVAYKIVSRKMSDIELAKEWTAVHRNDQHLFDVIAMRIFDAVQDEAKRRRLRLI